MEVGYRLKSLPAASIARGLLFVIFPDLSGAGFSKVDPISRYRTWTDVSGTRENRVQVE